MARGAIVLLNSLSNLIFRCKIKKKKRVRRSEFLMNKALKLKKEV